MSIFTCTRPPVKATPHALRSARPFGEGIFPARRVCFVPSAEDMQWAAETSPFANERYDVVRPNPAPIREESPEPDWDALVAEYEAQDRLERGYCL
jgi:hypothetical protein